MLDGAATTSGVGSRRCWRLLEPQTGLPVRVPRRRKTERRPGAVVVVQDPECLQQRTQSGLLDLHLSHSAARSNRVQRQLAICSLITPRPIGSITPSATLAGMSVFVSGVRIFAKPVVNLAPAPARGLCIS